MSVPVTERRLRIAVLGTRGIPEVMGGVETHCQALYPRLVTKGHVVTLFARKGYVTNEEPYLYKGVTVTPIWAPRRKSLEAICQTTWGIIQVAFSRSNYDLLHIHAIGPALLIPFARLLGLPVIITHHGPDYDRQKWGKLAKTILRLGEKFGCIYANRVITVSQHIRNCIKKLYDCNGTYIPNGVPIPALIPPGNAMQKWGISAGHYILTIGRLVPEKGFHDLISAYKTLETDWRLVIAGAADHEDEYSINLKKQAAEDPRIVMTGFIKGAELGEILSNSGLFVLPSYHEGLPIALLEAMSYNLPIIASDIPANCELAQPAETFPVGNVEALRQKIADFISSPVVEQNTRKRVETEFNWDAVADAAELVYLEAVRGCV